MPDSNTGTICLTSYFVSVRVRYSRTVVLTIVDWILCYHRLRRPISLLHLQQAKQRVFKVAPRCNGCDASHPILAHVSYLRRGIHPLRPTRHCFRMLGQTRLSCALWSYAASPAFKPSRSDFHTARGVSWFRDSILSAILFSSALSLSS